MKKRILSLDILRWLVIILMTLDHVRAFFLESSFAFNPLDIQQTNVALYFTRWITHLCAPVFVFLAGISIYLLLQKYSKKYVSWFLFTRWIWLIFLEVFIISFWWYFDPWYSIISFYILWAMWVSMILLSLLLFLPKMFLYLLGLCIVALMWVNINTGILGNVSILLYPTNIEVFGSTLKILYPPIPWMWIMILWIFYWDIFLWNKKNKPQKNKNYSLWLCMLILFLSLRYLNLWDISIWSQQEGFIKTIFSFLDVSKYPPSFLFILLTLWIWTILLWYFDKKEGSIYKIISVYWKVPLFFYIVHIYIIHLLSMGYAQLSGYWWQSMILYWWVNESIVLQSWYGTNLLTIYIITFLLILFLYPVCKYWYSLKVSYKKYFWSHYM
jgi:uncharacterized membrane protein